MAYNKNGEEILDTTPVAVPIRFKVPIPLNERIKQMVRDEASQLAQQNGYESFDEADDFDIKDDMPDPLSPWEEDFDPQVPFISDREAAIRAGMVNDLDEDKIHFGKAMLEKYKPRNKSVKAKAKPAPAGESQPEPLDEDDF